MNLKEFGLYFEKIRERSGFRSQRELADVSGVSHSTINRIESGLHKVSPDNLRKLAPFLKEVTYDELMEKLGYIGENRDNTNLVNGGMAFYGGASAYTEEERQTAVQFAETQIARGKLKKMLDDATLDEYEHLIQQLTMYRLLKKQK